jgi:hypothetical protein
MDPVVAAAKGMASIETMMKDLAVGLRSDVTLADLAGMLNVVRTNLVGDDPEGERSRERTAQVVDA